MTEIWKKKQLKVLLKHHCFTNEQRFSDVKCHLMDGTNCLHGTITQEEYIELIKKLMLGI